ncbi:MAG: LCP family protein [Chloroflexi bacterium]|nr:LCP family protein [Chloroflexota bacterium]
MTSLQKIIIAFLSILASALVAAVGYASWQVYQGWAGLPLGAVLPTSPYTPIGMPATWTAMPPDSIGLNPLVAATPYGAPRCGGPRVMTILAIGSDTRGSGYTWGLSDVMRAVRVDFVTPRVTVLDFPRDLWVEIPYIADNLNGQDREKLNQAYLYGNPGDGFRYWDDPSAGPGLLARTLDLNFGLKVDHYLAVNMKTFVKMVDAVGGIDVTLDKPLPNSNDADLQAGTHHLDGTKALEIARNRVDGVFARGDYQNIVLCALQKKLTSPKVVTQIPGLIKSFQGSVQTDLTPNMMSQLACLGTQLPRSNISFYSFPSDLFTGTRIYDPVFKKNVFVWDVNFGILRGYVAQFQAGTWPVSPEAASSVETESASFCN